MPKGKRDLKGLEERLNILAIPKEERAEAEAAGRPVRDVNALTSKLFRTSPQFDPSGVPSMGLRAGLSFADTDEERTEYLRRRVGEGGFTRDEYGNWAITPEGMNRLGMTHQGKPVYIDEPGFSFRDLADVAGSAPAALGAVAGGTAFGPAGSIAGAYVGRAGTELTEGLVGAPQQQGLLDIQKQALGDAAFAGVGEGAVQGLSAVGRKVLAPNAKRMTPAKRQVLKEAQELGAKPHPAPIAGGPVQRVGHRLVQRIAGDPNEEYNRRNLLYWMGQLRARAGTLPARGKIDLGEGISDDVATGYQRVLDWGKTQSQQVDKAIARIRKDTRVVPTERIKRTADMIRQGLVKSPQGDPVLGSKAVVSMLDDVDELPPFLTVDQMRQVVDDFNTATRGSGIIPGMNKRHARTLLSAARSSYEDIGNARIRNMVLRFRDQYAQRKQPFDQALIRRMMKEPGTVGAIEPEDILPAMFKRGKSSQLERVMRELPTRRQGEVRRTAMEDILSNVVERGDLPFEQHFTGKKFLETLDKYGRETLEAMFGKPQTDLMYKFGRTVQLVGDPMKATPGLVEASIMLHPIANAPRLAQMHVMSRLMTSEQGLRYLTEGLKAPRTRAGAQALTRAWILMGTMLDDEIGGPLPMVEGGE